MINPANEERVLITVKTYPTLSKKYGETVCTAGLRPDGTWVRIYPVPFRRLDEEEQYRKYDWVHCRLERNLSDPRPESYRPLDPSELRPVAHIGTDDGWRDRRDIVLGRAKIHTCLSELIDAAKANSASLAVFKPKSILAFEWESEEREWNPDKVREMRERTNQFEIFEEDTWRQTFKIIPKMPFSFSYRFEDADGRTSQLQILDWEAGALYWNCLRQAHGDERIALEKVRRKYMDEFLKTDVHFYLGTTQQFHFVAPNPWVIIGVFPTPRQRQLRLF